jgi:hypothetical protein
MTFKKVKNLLRKNANARNNVLSVDKFQKLLKHSPSHLIGILATGFYTGMRKGALKFTCYIAFTRSIGMLTPVSMTSPWDQSGQG